MLPPTPVMTVCRCPLAAGPGLFSACFARKVTVGKRFPSFVPLALEWSFGVSSAPIAP